MCLLAISLLAASLPGALPVRAEEGTGQPSSLYARSAVLMDADSGRILFGKKEREVLPMASTTKIMTCILALEEMEEGQTAKVSDYAASQPKVRLGVRGKEEYRIQDLLYALMLESYNDSAVVIAEGISGSVEAFADRMNQKARELGCADTHFRNAQRAGRGGRRRDPRYHGGRPCKDHALLHHGVVKAGGIPCHHPDRSV
mgnify:CR=1 FL=1